MYHVEIKPRLRVPDFIQRIARKLLIDRDDEEREAFLSDLAEGLVDPDKWQVEKDEDWLQF